MANNCALHWNCPQHQGTDSPKVRLADLGVFVCSLPLKLQSYLMKRMKFPLQLNDRSTLPCTYHSLLIASKITSLEDCLRKLLYETLWLSHFS